MPSTNNDRLSRLFETQPIRVRPYLGWETPQSRQRAHSACSKNPSTRVDTISIGYSTSNLIKSEANQTVSMKKNEKKNNNQTERAGGDTSLQSPLS